MITVCENCHANSECIVNYTRKDQNFPDRLKHISHLHIGSKIRMLAQYGNDIDSDDGMLCPRETRLLNTLNREKQSLCGLFDIIDIEHIPETGRNGMGYYSYSDICGYYWIDAMHLCRRCFRNGNAICIQEFGNVPSRLSEVKLYLSKNQAQVESFYYYSNILNKLERDNVFVVKFSNLKHELGDKSQLRKRNFNQAFSHNPSHL